MKNEEYMKNGEQSVILLKTELEKIFGEEYTVSIRLPTIGFGKGFFSVSLYNVKPGSTDLQYSNACCVRFCMHLYNGAGKQVDMDKFSFEVLKVSYNLKNNGLKFRKITKPTPLEAAQKLLEWFNTSEELIKSIGTK
jgi:hypothetical protein